MEKKVKIIWLGHACFKFEWENYAVVIDPYEDGNVPGLPALRTSANQVLYSHEHEDHYGQHQVIINENNTIPYQVKVIDTYHDHEQGKLRGENRIHILTDSNFKIAHLGDLGCLLSEEQIDQLKGLDVLMIPVGGEYTIDAAQARDLVDKIKPRVVIPMHYRSETFGYPPLSMLDEYTKRCHDVRRYPDNCFILTKTIQSQTAVLTYSSADN